MLEMNRHFRTNAIQDELVLLRANDPMAVMLMPGCYEDAVNEQGSKLFGGSPSIVHTHGNLEAFVKKSRARTLRSYDLCACTKAESILALEPEHCCFEAAWPRLRSSPPGIWVTTVGFLKMDQQPCSREYEVFLAHSKKLSKQVDRLLVRLVKVDGLFLVVKTLESQGLIPTELELFVEDRTNNTTLRSPKTFRTRSASSTYWDFAGCLQAAQQKEDSDKHGELLQCVNRIAKGYEPVQAWVQSFFNQGKNAGVEIQRALQRTFDAPAAVEIKQMIEHMVASQRNLARWTLSAHELNSLDAVRVMKESGGSGDTSLSSYDLNMRTFTKSILKLAGLKRGDFVAVVDGKVVGHDSDELVLCRRVSKKYRGREMLIRPVGLTPSRKGVNVSINRPGLSETKSITISDTTAGQAIIADFEEW